MIRQGSWENSEELSDGPSFLQRRHPRLVLQRGGRIVWLPSPRRQTQSFGTGRLSLIVQYLRLALEAQVFLSVYFPGLRQYYSCSFITVTIQQNIVFTILLFYFTGQYYSCNINAVTTTKYSLQVTVSLAAVEGAAPSPVAQGPAQVRGLQVGQAQKCPLTPTTAAEHPWNARLPSPAGLAQQHLVSLRGSSGRPPSER